MLLIAACSILTILAAVFVLRPLFGETENSLDILLMAETEADRLADRKAAIYGNLKDLTLEYQMGRLSDEDFRNLESGYKADAASILQKLEQMGVSESLEASIEGGIASRRKPPQTDKPGRRADRTLCPSCGADIIPGKKFCADCGHEL